MKSKWGLALAAAAIWMLARNDAIHPGSFREGGNSIAELVDVGVTTGASGINSTVNGLSTATDGTGAVPAQRAAPIEVVVIDADGNIIQQP